MKSEGVKAHLVGTRIGFVGFDLVDNAYPSDTVDIFLNDHVAAKIATLRS